MIKVSVIVATYNPEPSRLNKTLEGLKLQTLDNNSWELIIVDNNSSNKFDDMVDLSWHSNASIVLEKQQGLTYARVRGFEQSKGEIIVLVDDDNILQTTYLQEALRLMKESQNLGAAGGKSLPMFESEQPSYLKQFYNNLALRDLGEEVVLKSWESTYPHEAPLGAGMIIRRQALNSYRKKITSTHSIILDRQGESLASGGDNDIIIEILKSGWLIGYFPSLGLQHIIPAERMTVSYLARLNNQSNKSWVKLLESHQINPWKMIPAWTVPLRKIKAWVVYKAWQSNINYINWRGACGMFDGLKISNN